MSSRAAQKTPIVDADQTGLRRAAHATFIIFGEFTMPLESILFLSLVVGSLSAFAMALAYADWATNTVAPISDIATGRPASTAKTLNRYSADGALASR